MGKKNRTGLDYFQVDVDIYEDEKILFAQELVDPEGIDPWLRFSVPHLAIRLLREIYKEGYAIEFNDRVALTMASKMNSVITMGVLKKIVAALLNSGFFDTTIYETKGYLTSHGIQERWYFICKSAKRRNLKIPKDINLLTSPENDIPEVMPKTPEVMPKTPEVMPSYDTLIPHIDYTIPINNDNKGNSKDNNSNGYSDYNAKTPEEVTKTPEEVTKTPEEVTKTPEEVTKTPEEVTKTPEIIKINANNQHFPFPLESCLWHYLYSPDFEGARTVHLSMFVLDLDPQVARGKLVGWAQSFKRNLLSKNRTTISMSGGDDSWLTYFPRFVNRVIAKSGYIDPETLFSSKGLKVGEEKKEKPVKIRQKTAQDILAERGLL